nr:hypothetical protein [Tanacetum cinerariifolium]
MNQDSYNSNSLGFDQPQPPPSPVIHQPPQELSIQEMEDLKQQYLDELKRLSNLEYRDENKIAELTENFNGESDFFLEVDAFLAVEDEPTSSQFPKSYLDLEGDMLLLETFLNDDHSFDFKTKSSSTSLNSLLEETNNFDNSLPDNDQSCSDEDVLEKIVSKPLFEEEIIHMKMDQHPDNVESDLLESLRTHDSSLLISSKIESLLDEDILLPKDLPINNSLSCAEKESVYFDIPPFS